MVDHLIEIPRVLDIFEPVLSVIPLQFLAYQLGLLKGRNVDQPKNLAKVSDR
jgi:glucosamine--fructose-6-phosphate aminotransferase (isomerizing)